MTTIIAKRLKDGAIELGWDSRASGDGESYRAKKVSFVNQQFYIGVAGSVRYGNVVHHVDVPAVDPVVFESSGFVCIFCTSACSCFSGVNVISAILL